MMNKNNIIRLGFASLSFVIAIMSIIIDLKYDYHISFSKESGFYNDEFELEILGGGRNNIYYTLDGSPPTTDDFLYEDNNPIFIADTSCNENVYSTRTDVSAAFQEDLVDKYSNENPGYTIPDHNVDKCNVVRAAVFDDNGECLDSITGVFFIGFENKTGYDGIYTASIITDPCNLFSYETGIYITGETFDNYKETSLGTAEDWATPYWEQWSSNYSNRGIEWEREAVVTVFDESRKNILSEKCGIRIQGGGSRGKLPKSIGCYARELYGGSKEFRVDLFDENFYPHKFVFFSGGDDNVFKIKDYMVNAMGDELGFATMDFIPCTLFLDGEYWGVYYMIENYNSDYISDHYGVKKDNVIMMKNWEVAEGESVDYDLFYNMRSFVLDNDMAIKENYEEACNLIDIESFIDYYATQIYIARGGDWPGGNWAMWRTREDDGSAYGDCRWRWMLFDVNSTGMYANWTYSDTLARVLEEDPLFYSLYLNEDFRIKFAERILYIGKEIFSYERCEKFLDDYTRIMKDSIEKSSLRFYNDEKSDEFDDNVENIRFFFLNRYDAIWELLKNNMGEAWLNKNMVYK